MSKYSSFSQEPIPWYNPAHSEINKNAFKSKAGDCHLVKKGIDKSLNANIQEFEPKPFFIHTLPEFKKWMGNKYLVESRAHIYQADKAKFLIIDFKINSENAKSTYGRLDYGAKMKCFLADGSSLYLENVERDKGKVNRNKDFTTYRGVFAIDNYNSKALQKNRLIRIGLIWEEGYQEYLIQNNSLIQNQLECLD